MDGPDFDAMLTATLADRRMSRAERKALAAWVRDLPPNAATYADLRRRVFGIARQHASGTDEVSVIDWLEEVLQVLVSPQSVSPTSRACFSPGDQCLEAITTEFAGARVSADVCVFTITDNRVTRAMEAAHRRGVRVRVITDNDKSADLGSDIGQLRSAGIVVREDQSPFHMHHKFALFDDRTILTGSYNWTRSAAESNEENLIVTDDPNLVRRFRGEFDKLWAKVEARE